MPDTFETPASGEPFIEVDPSLPISAHVDEITQLVRDNQVVVVAGETGSGKTTQLPKIALALGRRRIGHTQPRRIAARSVAERMADELGVPLGELVGYQVRFTRAATKQTRVKVMTDGIMLAEINHDRQLRRYDTIIIDEAHERSLNIDFLLGYLKQLLPARPELKVIITSATIDTVRFAEHFAAPDGTPAPVVEVSGRTWPVEVRYRPPAQEDPDMPGAIVSAVRELGPSGDVLVFLSGEREIADAAAALDDAGLGAGTEVLPLFSRLSAAEQRRIFAPHRTRRIVLATNVAETSLTVPGIRYVIDTGLARISRYSARTKVQRLPVEPVSRASADQRAGRCGRLGPGVCIRLYSEEDYLTRPEFTEPEILRTNLASVILKMASAELGDINDFPFVEPPDHAQVADGLRLLGELGALKGSDRRTPRLTSTGHRLAEMPVDPRLGRMLIEASRRGCLREVEVIAAALAMQDVRERPAEKRQQADRLHRRFLTDEILTEPSGASAPEPDGRPARYTPQTGRKGEFDEPVTVGPGGDVMAIWRLWCYLRTQRRRLSGNQFRRLCRAEFINHLRVREWQDLRSQLSGIGADLHLRRNDRPGSTEAVLQSVLSGLLSHIGLLEVETGAGGARHRGRRRGRGPREYLGARGTRFAISPGSALAKQNPPLVMAVELVETSRLWAHTCARIEPEWVESVAGPLVKYGYSEPHWSSSSAAVLASQRATLYGVPLVSGRLVDYGRVNPAEAREIFIRTGLVENGWQPARGRVRHDFIEHNQRMRDEVAELEERTRRRDLLVDDQTIFDFYDARIPATVHSGATFDSWWSREPDQHLLDLSMDDLVRKDADGVDAGAFPDSWRVGELRLPVSYVFDPGSGADGVTVRVRLAELNQLRPEPFSWQVPGLRTELATELIRALPKTVRTSFVPAPDHARAALRWLKANGADHERFLHDELGRALHALTGVVVEPGQWDPGAVPEHLRVRFQVVEKDRVARQDKDLAALQQDLAERVSDTLTRVSRDTARTGATGWEFGTIEPTRTIRRGGLQAVGHPALRDDGDSVALFLADTAQAAASSHERGIRRLLVLVNPDPTRWVVSHLGRQERLWLGNNPYESVPELLADARLKAVDRAARAHADPAQVRDEAQFTALAAQVRAEQADVMRDVVATAAAAIGWARQIRADLPGSPAATAEDVTAQLENLVFPGFISFTTDPWYQHLPRYLQAASMRLDSARADPARDEDLMAGFDELAAEYDELCEAQPPGPLSRRIDDIGFLLEEYRVQLFAQRLGTSQTVSPKRIRRAIARAADQG
ncbi:ATP-dependent RNA helicase HrpA [Propionibacterium australiense]|uniref:RNA helicase n=1 Tax=Propionibacterium australiense TaxID=119981 RepID=A0A383S577_9ACTN|nr:ATP-dependent RNA helicase HrpA [Propionibacterium australiense]RLP10646.1 ATP-dependent RNA helicase HrpA [Propionibacterium australiense]RLP12941.1 ATP-dependent RNA helicase HrpA [Propionibacterium australiense]SYZ32851.1 RNA helicase [Propionibacterium australiense]VEH91117.1 ATP-dependent RNA helicase HrpA [Propionibacterium australiense]